MITLLLKIFKNLIYISVIASVITSYLYVYTSDLRKWNIITNWGE